MILMMTRGELWAILRKNCGKILGQDQIFCNELMKCHTSFKIGGPADFFVKLKNIEQLKSVKEIALKNNIPFVIVGNGSNLLVRDKGIRGIVGKLDFEQLEINQETGKVIASADYPVSKLARECAQKGLSKMEFLAGIPRNFRWSN